MELTNVLKTTYIGPDTKLTVDTQMTIQWPPFRNITCTDINRFIQIPIVIEVDATDNILTAYENVYHDNYDPIKCSDYAIYADVSKSNFFNVNAMTWNYSVQKFSNGEVHMVDAGATLDIHNTSEWVVNADNLVSVLSSSAKATRFVHYKQSNSFFKYSFKVGDPFETKDGLQAQLWAVYLDSITGTAHPYELTTSDPNNQSTPESKVYICAHVPSNDFDIMFTPNDHHVPQQVTLIVPPDAEFLQNGPLGYNLDHMDISGNLHFNIRNVPGLTYYTHENFVMYDDTIVQTPLEIFMYYIVNPPADKPFLGEQMIIAYTSNTEVLPIRDPSPVLEDLGPRSKVFFIDDPTYQSNMFYSLKVYDHPPPRLYHPVSYFSVRPTAQEEPMNIPLQYDTMNNTDLGDFRKLSLGGRFMQLVSEYMFDAATEKEMSFFPFLLSEAASLNSKIVLELAMAIQNRPDVRNEILRQMLIKYGRKYFNEWSALAGETNLPVGEVIEKIDEMFIYFTVTLSTCVSNRSKDRVDSIVLEKIPVVIRIYDDNLF